LLDQLFFPSTESFRLPKGVIFSFTEGDHDKEDIKTGFGVINFDDGIIEISVVVEENSLVPLYKKIISNLGNIRMFLVKTYSNWNEDDIGEIEIYANEELNTVAKIVQFVESNRINTLENGFVTLTTYFDEGATHVNVSDHKTIVILTDNDGISERVMSLLTRSKLSKFDSLVSVQRGFYHLHYRQHGSLDRTQFIDFLKSKGFDLFPIKAPKSRGDIKSITVPSAAQEAEQIQRRFGIMKYFTRGLYQRMQPIEGMSEEETEEYESEGARLWMAAEQDYKSHLEAIQDDLPGAVSEFTRLAFHDSEIHSEILEEEGAVRLELDTFNARRGIFTLTFLDVVESEGIDNIDGDIWRYDEAYLSARATFEIRVLCDSSEFRITANQLQIDQRPRSLGEKQAEDLSVAASFGDIQEARRLLDEGADVNEKDEGGRTALHWACQEGHLEFVKFLVEKGANLDTGDDVGFTPLQTSVGEDDINLVKYLLKNGANVNAGLPLRTACAYGKEKIVNILLAHGADPNARDGEGCTAIFHAVMDGHIQIIKTLIKHGAQLDVTDNEGVSPLSLAQSNGDEEIIELLKSGNIS